MVGLLATGVAAAIVAGAIGYALDALA